MTEHGSIIYLEGVTVDYDGFKALNNLNFIVNHRELRVVIGPNGAGKTTLLDVISGKTKPVAGRVIFGKVDAADAAAKGKKSEQKREGCRHQQTGENRSREAVKGLPEQRQLRYLIPHHEIRQGAAVDAFVSDREHEVHPHAVRPQTEEHPLSQTEDAGIAPDQVQTQGENGEG